jgi:hypothetical protein
LVVCDYTNRDKLTINHLRIYLGLELVYTD